MDFKTTTGELVSSTKIKTLTPHIVKVKSLIDHWRDREKITHWNCLLVDGRIVEFKTTEGERVRDYLNNLSDPQST